MNEQIHSMQANLRSLMQERSSQMDQERYTQLEQALAREVQKARALYQAFASEVDDICPSFAQLVREYAPAERHPDEDFATAIHRMSAAYENFLVQIHLFVRALPDVLSDEELAQCPRLLEYLREVDEQSVRVDTHQPTSESGGQ